MTLFKWLTLFPEKTGLICQEARERGYVFNEIESNGVIVRFEIVGIPQAEINALKTLMEKVGTVLQP